MTEESISPLRRRMIEDMSVRHFASKTQHDYIRAVVNLARFLGRSPDTATNEDLRRFQLHLTENGAGTSLINSTVSALRFFFTVTLDRADAARHLTVVHRAAQAAGRPEPRGGRAPLGGGARRQIQGRAQRRLWRRPARLRGRVAEGLRHRQQAHDAARRAGQGRQGSPRDALAAAARASARLVAHRAAARLAVSRAEPDQSDDDASARLAPATPPPRWPRSTSAFPCIRCGTALRRTCWSRTSISA